MKTDMNLFSRIMHELVVCATEYFPVTREGGMRNDEVARRAAIIISYFSVVGADPVSRRGTGCTKVKNLFKDGGVGVCEDASYLDYHLVGSMSVRKEVRFNQRAELEPLPPSFVPFGNVSVTVPISVLSTSIPGKP